MNKLGSREFWVPGRRQGAVFLVIVFLGLGAWAFKEAVFPPLVESEGPFFMVYLILDTGFPLYALLAFGSGFFAPRGFYLWGIAAVLSHPFATLVSVAYRQSLGFDIVRGGVEGWVGYAFVLVMMTLVTAVFVTTPLSAAGAGLRLLLDHLRHGRPGTSRDVRA